ncbi:unnamed protein product, partial [Allacma fusca]
MGNRQSKSDTVYKGCHMRLYNSYFREGNGEATLKIIPLDKDMNFEAGHGAVETNPVPSTSVTSQGTSFTGTMRDIIQPINTQG